MSTFVDTSALFAILDADDLNHLAAKETWARLLDTDETLVTTNYVLVETHALVQRRLGMTAVKAFYQDILPVLQVEWIGSSQHTAAVGKLIATANRQLSLVDWVSFTLMRQLGIHAAFAFDADFDQQGFQATPPSDPT